MAINPNLMQIDGGGTPAPSGAGGITDSQNAARLAAEAAATKAAADKAAKSASEDAYYTAKVGTTGKTQAQLDAAQNAADTAKMINDLYGNIGITSKVDAAGKVVTDTSKVIKTPTGKTPEEIAAEKAAADAALAAEKAATAQAKAEAAIAAAKSAAELKAAKDALDKANADAAAAAAAAAAQAAKDLAAAKASGNAAAQAAAQARADAAAAAAAAANAAKNINVTGNTVTPAAGTSAADIAAKAEKDRLAALAVEKEQARQSTIQILTDRFTKYNLQSLAPKIKQLAIDGASEATITLQLQESDEYKTRFKANAERVAKGLAVLSPVDYLNTEDSYRQALRAYGLKQFDTDEYVSQFIANDMSPTELSGRIQLAVQRVQNADPAISKTLRDYYGIGQADLVAYTLDPATQFQKIERQVQAAEIGSAARLQGLETGSIVAEQLAAQGVTQAEAQKGYATIADILPTAEKLSAIYGTTLEGYNQSTAEQEVFNSLASAQRARQRLSAREIAQFSGSSGTSKSSLTSNKVGQI